MTNPSSTNESYVFDAVGNRTSSNRSNTYTYQANNKLTSTQTANYAYDSNGNMAGKNGANGKWNYHWDYENRLTLAQGRKDKVRYQYDALGRRVVRNAYGKGLTKYTYDGADVILDDDSQTGITKYQNGAGVDNKLKLTNNGASKYFLADHLGSTNALTDSNGAIVSQTSYDGFGNASNANIGTRYQYTGREYDNVTGLHYYRARWYSAELGRFVSEDPIGFNGGDINLYGYVANRPLIFRDPTGEIIPLVVGGVVVAGVITFYLIYPPVANAPVPNTPTYPMTSDERTRFGYDSRYFECGPGPFDKYEINSLRFGLSSIIPQQPFGYNFKFAGCYQHDVCYGTCGKTQGECDVNFFNDLAKECSSKGDAIEKQKCLLAAGGFYKMVDSSIGAKAYADSQKYNHCDCNK